MRNDLILKHCLKFCPPGGLCAIWHWASACRSDFPKGCPASSLTPSPSPGFLFNSISTLSTSFFSSSFFFCPC